MYLHELLIDSELDFEDFDYALFCLYSLIKAGQEHMDEVEPDDDNFVFVRLPID